MTLKYIKNQGESKIHQILNNFSDQKVLSLISGGISLAPLTLCLSSLPKVKTRHFCLAQVSEHLKIWRMLMWFSDTIFKLASLIISKSQDSQFFLVLTVFLKADFPAWFKHPQNSFLAPALALSHTLKFEERLQSCLRGPRVCPGTTQEPRISLVSFQLCCHWMAPKPMEKSWPVRWGWGRRASLQDDGILPPWPVTSRIFPAPEDTGEQSEYLSFRSMAEQVRRPLSAFLQDSTCTKTLLN